MRNGNNFTLRNIIGLSLASFVPMGCYQSDTDNSSTDSQKESVTEESVTEEPQYYTYEGTIKGEGRFHGTRYVHSVYAFTIIDKHDKNKYYSFYLHGTAAAVLDSKFSVGDEVVVKHTELLNPGEAGYLRGARAYLVNETLE